VQIDANLVERLLYEEESNELDFKREQYKFAGADDQEKSELLKDIVAFANAWRRSDAFILTGVEEIKGGKSIVIGIAQDLDDAQLQQFVNSKTQRPVLFSYRAVQVDSLRVGVIHVPMQSRPIFLTRDYGKLKAGTVYIRRGSSTAIADPDEIARMGGESFASAIPEPKLRMGLGNRGTMELRGTEVAIEVVRYFLQGGIPDFKDRTARLPFEPPSRPNSNYYREMVSYVRFKSHVGNFNIAVVNDGDVLAQDVRVVFEAGDPNDCFVLYDKRDWPRAPESHWPTLAMPRLPVQSGLPLDVTVKHVGKSWHVEAALGKIQPKDTSWTRNKLMIGASISGIYTISAKIFADNLACPVSCDVQVDVKVTDKSVDYLELEKLYIKELREKYKDKMVKKRQRL
jgi:Putative DNA-binding domain